MVRSNFIATLTVISVICLIALVLWELHTKEPILDFRLFKNVNFAKPKSDDVQEGPAPLLNHRAHAAIPAKPSRLHCGNSRHGALRRRHHFACRVTHRRPAHQPYPTRYLMAFGWGTLTIAMFFSTKRIDLDISFASATWLRIAQYVPMGFIFIPATMVAYLGIPQEKSNAVAGFVNFVRNIGASVGTSAVVTILARREQSPPNHAHCPH